MKKVNIFNLHSKAEGLDLTTLDNKKKVHDAVKDILNASRRPKNPVYDGLIGLDIKDVQQRSVTIESNESSQCTDAWKHDFGKKLANKYGFKPYTDPVSGKRYLFK